MKNREKYKEQFDRFLCNHAALVNGEFRICQVTSCEICDFHKLNDNTKTCYRFVEAWLDEESTIKEV